MNLKKEEVVRWVSAGVVFIVPLGALAVHWHLKIKDVHSSGLDMVSLCLIAASTLPFLATLIQSAKVAGFELNFVQRKVAALDAEVQLLRFLAENFLTFKELEHLERLSDSRPIVAKMDYYPERFQDELFRLAGLGFIKAHPGKGLTSLFGAKGENARNVHDYYYITDKGRQFLAMRRADHR